MRKSNYFITLEGIEGAGKTTVMQLIAEILHDKKIAFIQTREPGGTPIAEEIRKTVLGHHPEAMHPDTELLLYFAARAQHLNAVIKPALAANKWVICDRFTDSTYAYQSAGHKVTKERVATIENWVQGELRPDLTIILDIPPEEGLARTRKRNNGFMDRIESEELDFFQLIREYYLQLAQIKPQRYKLINALQPLQAVQQELLRILNLCCQI